MNTRKVKFHKVLGCGPMYRAIAKHQRAGRTVAVISLRAEFDLRAAAVAGVNVVKLLVSQPDDPEMAHDIHDALKRSGAIDVCYADGEFTL
jgi:RecA/RadA recombinase